MTSPLDGARVVVTGGYGFLGWHLACRLGAVHGCEVVRLGRDHFSSPARLTSAIGDATAVIHLAGINRADSDEAVESGNVELATRLATAIRDGGHPMHVVYGNSIHARGDNPYGRGKARASRILRDGAAAVGGTLADIYLPNLFGEHGRPNYNSFVATFCHSLATGGKSEVQVDSEIPLMHAQDAAAILIEAASHRQDQEVEPEAEPRRVSAVLAQLEQFQAIYATGEIPSLPDDFSVNLFNTYRSYLFPEHYPLHPVVHADARGELFETVRAHGGTGMTFASTTRPGMRRGDHYHLRKIERFFVVSGEAEVALRRLYHDDVVRFRLSGTRPGFIDMPTMWIHNIRNIGESDLVTVFWADQLLDQANPDQFPMKVEEA